MRPLKNEELFTLRELLIQEIEFAFGIRDLPDSEHDGDDTEHDAVDFAGHYNVDVERNMSGFGYDIVHAERLRTVSISFKQVDHNNKIHALNFYAAKLCK